MTKQRFFKTAGVSLLVLIILIIIVGFTIGQSARDVLNILSFVIPTIIVMGGVFYFFWRMVSITVSKPKPGANLEVRKSKGFVPYADRKAALNSSPNVKKLWIALIAYMILSSVYGIVRLVLEFIQNGELSKAQEVLKGMPLTGLAIGGTLMALLFIVGQGIYIVSMYRMEKWVRWFMLVGFLSAISFIIPSFKASDLYALIANVAILGIYFYIIRKVYIPKK